MRYNYFILVTFLLNIISVQSLYAQKAEQGINLETVLKLCSANNLTIKECAISSEIALSEQRKAKEWWLPSIYAGFRTHYLDGAAMNTDGSILNDFNRDNAWVGLGLGAEIDFNKGAYQSVVLKQKAAAVSYYGTAQKNQLILEAVQAYFNLQSEQLKYSFLQELVLQADTLAQQLKIQTDAGIRMESDYLLAKSNLNHFKIEMLQAKLNWLIYSAKLIQLLNLENQNVLLRAENSVGPIDLNVDVIDSTNFENRAEYMALQSQLAALQSQKNSINKGLLLPKLKFGIDNGAFGDYSDVSNNTTQLNASLLWNIPFGRLTYNGDGKIKESQRLMLENRVEKFENQFSTEISIASSKEKISKEQMEIAKEALTMSGKALNQSIQRQKLGTSKPFEVFQTQEIYFKAQLDYLKTVATYNKAQFQLKVARGENL